MVRPVARDHYFPGRYTIDHPSNKCNHAISNAKVVHAPRGQRIRMLKARILVLPVTFEDVISLS
eukprot:Skav209993  [mRNA]  locus=scaffold3061:4758:4949:- [translate_table: standard]